MAEEKRKGELLPRPRNYENFRDLIEEILKEANKPISWTEIKEKAHFQQRVPNNKWVKWME